MISLLGKRWHVPEEPPRAWFSERGTEHDLPPSALTLAWARGCRSAADLAVLLEPPPLETPDLPDLDRAVRRLLLARENGECVLIAGDYDADGICAAALAGEGLGALGLRVAVHLPRRQDGYGLRPGALAALLEEHRASLVLAVDNGSTAYEALELAAARGVDVVVADHHRLQKPLPAVAALVNPWRAPQTPWTELTGTGVTWCLVQALARALGAEAPPSLDLVAIGTVADIAPLAGPNRWLVRGGLDAMARPSRPGLAALLAQARVSPGQRPTLRDISHGVAPRLNAPGRMGDPRPALDLLRAADAASALGLLAEVEEANRRRQEEAARVVAEAEAAILRSGEVPGVVLLADAGWSPGLVGLAAGALCEKFAVPVLLAGQDGQGRWRGSGRAPQHLDLAAALERCGPLVSGGGHAQAVGFEVDDAALPQLRAAMEALFPRGGPTAGRWELDGILTPRELDLGLGLALERLGPLEPPPRFLLRGVRLEDVRTMGTSGQHVRALTRVAGAPAGCPVVAFGLGDWAEGLGSGETLDLVVEPEVHRFRNAPTLRLTVRDLAPSGGDWTRFATAARAGVRRRHPDRESLRGVYRRVQQLARGGQLPPALALVAHLAPATVPDPSSAEAALTILQELGVLDASGGFQAPPAGTRLELEASPRFRAAEAMRQAVERLEAAARDPEPRATADP